MIKVMNYHWKIAKLNPSSTVLKIELWKQEKSNEATINTLISEDLILPPFFETAKGYEKKIKKFKKGMLDKEKLFTKESCPIK